MARGTPLFDRYFLGRSLMSDLFEKIQQCQTLPTLPATALRVLQMTGDDEPTVRSLAEVVGQDPALTLRLLRAVNSSQYGVTRKVQSIPQAVALLGLHTVKMQALGFSLTASLPARRDRGFDFLSYWRRCMYAATAARVISGQFLPAVRDECFVAALLMDMGVLVLHEALGEQYDRIYQRAGSHRQLLELELAEMSLSHADVGGFMARRWGLPEALVHSIGSHHSPETVVDERGQRIARLVGLAGRCADVFTNTSDTAETILSVRKEFSSAYEQDDLTSDRLLCTIGRNTSQLAALFDVRLNSSANYERIVATAAHRLLELAVGERDASDLAEKRRAVRITRDGTVTITPCVQGTLYEPRTVRMRDLSSCGLGLSADDALEVGSEFVLALAQGSGPAKTLLYQVKRCESADKGYYIGAELKSVLRPDRPGGDPPRPGPANRDCGPVIDSKPQGDGSDVDE